MDEILQYYHSIETSLGIISHGTIMLFSSTCITKMNLEYSSNLDFGYLEDCLNGNKCSTTGL